MTHTPALRSAGGGSYTFTNYIHGTSREAAFQTRLYLVMLWNKQIIPRRNIWIPWNQLRGSIPQRDPFPCAKLLHTCRMCVRIAFLTLGEYARSLQTHPLKVFTRFDRRNHVALAHWGLQKKTKEGKSAINLSNLGKFCQIWPWAIYLC